MKWIGLTGGLGCGKSTVAEIIRKQGYPVVDADRIVHHMYETDVVLHKKLREAFGEDVVSGSRVCRDKLSGILRENIKNKKKLEGLVHPQVQEKLKEIKARLSKNHAKMAFYDVPLLFENNLQGNFDKTIFVIANQDLIYQRLQTRNGWKKDEVDQRMSWLLPNHQKAMLADFVIENNSSIEDLEKAVVKILRAIYQE